MKKIISILTVIVAVLSMSFAADAYDGWSEGTLKNMRYYGTQILIQQNNQANPGNCADSTYIVIKTSNSGFEHLNAALLTAYAGGLNVNIALDGCSGGGTAGYGVIEQVWLKP